MTIDSFAASKVIPANKKEILDASGGNATSTKQDSDWFWADEAGIAKISYKDSAGNVTTEVLQVQAGVNQIANITQLWQYYVGTTDGTVKSYSDAGSLVTNSIKLRWNV